MATAKPAALTTNFYRSVRSCRPQTYRSLQQSLRPALQPEVTCTPLNQTRSFSIRRHLQQEPGYQRYGPAATRTEPFLPSTEQTNQDATALENKEAERKEKEAQYAQQELEEEDEADQQIEATQTMNSNQEAIEPHAEELTQAQKSHVELIQDKQTSQTSPNSGKSVHGNYSNSTAEDDGPLPNRELDMVLSIPSPNEVKGNNDGQPAHPHLEASPYEHHFDTYSLVIELCKPTPPASTTTGPETGNTEPIVPFSEPQSVTLMKAIRLMLAQNLDLAKDGLVSKSDTENETYLFRAACSELKTTMQTSRFMEAQKQRSQRAQLQHEFDILNQKVSQDIMTMREELKGMFNDRKLGLQEEKRQVDGKIQGLSYRISVDLNSEAKSEVEGLRWVLTRRAALAIAAAASMTLAFLQYYSVKSREAAEVEKKKQAERQKQAERIAREQERMGTAGRSTGTQTDQILLNGADGSSYEESLG